MQTLGLFRDLQPTCYSGLFDDPLLLVHVRPAGRSLLFDCGQLHHLAKRVLRTIDAIFVSHAHMDHLMGFDQLLRHVHVAPRTLHLFGPPGIAQRIAHKLSGYDWNLTEESWCTFQVHEVDAECIHVVQFAGSRGYVGQRLGTEQRQDRTIFRSPYVHVEADICDHKLPVLIFRVTERPAFLIDRQRLQESRLLPGPWLKDLKKRFHAGDWRGEPIEAWREVNGQRTTVLIEDAAQLYRSIRRDHLPGSLGYVSDVGMSDDNLARIARLMAGVKLLVCECTFLARDEDKARVSAHLCTADVNRIAARICPDVLLPVHLSKSYLGSSPELYAELDPPPETRLLQLPDYLTPRPLLPSELPVPLPLPKKT
ncbi:MAG: MBL fold metallo-hydrolase [Desulfuromonadales bacterium]